MFIVFIIALTVALVESERTDGVKTNEHIGIFFRWFSVIFIAGAAGIQLTNYMLTFRKQIIQFGQVAPLLSLQFTMFVAIIINKVTMSYDAQYSTALVWSIFNILVGFSEMINYIVSSHEKENNEGLSEIWWNSVPSTLMIVTGFIGL